MISNSITIRKTNLYARGIFIQFPDGSQLVTRKVLQWKGEIGDRFYEIKKGDEISKIAWTMYQYRAGDNASELWWVIADVNSIINPFGLDSLIGQSLLIPDYDKLQLLL